MKYLLKKYLPNSLLKLVIKIKYRKEIIQIHKENIKDDRIWGKK